MSEDDDYDVVLDTLQQAIDRRNKLNAGNETWGVMDFIRCEQIDELKKAVTLWKVQPEKREPLSEEEIDQKLLGNDYYSRSFTAGVRFAEKHHGIKQP